MAFVPPDVSPGDVTTIPGQPYLNNPYVPVDETDANNFLLASRGVLTIDVLERFELYCTEFNLPGLTTNAPELENPFSRTVWTPDKLFFDELNVTFLVREDLKNWLILKDWMYGMAFPHDHKQFKNRILTQHDATLHIFGAQNLPILRVRYTNALPVRLGEIVFSSTDNQAEPKSSMVQFAYDTYIVEFPNRDQNVG